MGLRILGIDPGSRKTGYGVIEIEGNRNWHIAHGAIDTGDGDLPEKLMLIFEGINEVIRLHQPQEAAVEKVFVKLNVSSALILGQARGAAICAAAQTKLLIHEYAPAQIKQAIVGNGRAEKSQIQHMVKILLKLSELPQPDAADGLACALCHAHQRTFSQRVTQALRGARR